MGRRTPLYDQHVALGARMVDFAGWDMPLQYAGVRQEHLAVRQGAGLFDVSHMGEVVIDGADALAAVQRLVTNDASRLVDGQALYSVMCTDSGGIVDDVVVMRRRADHLVVVVNASTREKDVAHMRGVLDGTASELRDVSDHIALLALQGPRAASLLAPLCSIDVASLRPFHWADAVIAGIESRPSAVSRTGYTGEDGFEVMLHSDQAPAVWNALLAAGGGGAVQPCGLAARDTLRLEAGLRLYGQDMDEAVDPYSAGLGWTVKLDKGDFVGAPALRRLHEEGPPRRTVGLALGGRDIARHGQSVHQAAGMRVGEVTSGTFSFTLGHGIALALVDAGAAGQDAFEVDIRGTRAAARRVPLPFYRRPT